MARLSENSRHDEAHFVTDGNPVPCVDVTRQPFVGRAVRASLRSLDTASQARGPDSPSGLSSKARSSPLPSAAKAIAFMIDTPILDCVL